MAQLLEQLAELQMGDQAGLWVVLATLATVLATVLVVVSIQTGREPTGPREREGHRRREEVTKSDSSETVSTATGGSDSPRSSYYEKASASCWPWKDLLAPCMGVAGNDSGLRPRGEASWSAEYKFGIPRSKLYSTSFAPINEDIRRLVEVAIPERTKHEEAHSKLRRLRQLSEGLPSNGWVQSQDMRVLLRFLLARQMNVERALEMLQSVLQWRQQNGVSNALPLWDKALHERFDRYFKCLAFTGTDLDGDHVVVERCGKVHAQSLANCSEDFLARHVIYSAECVLASMERLRQDSWKEGKTRGFQLTVVIDLEGIDMSFADRRLLAMSKVMGRIEKDNYPEVLKRVIVVRAPWFFPAIFQMLKPFMDPGTVAKILVPKAHETRDVLQKYVSAEALPQDLGGCLQDDVQLIPPGGVLPQEIIDRSFQYQK